MQVNQQKIIIKKELYKSIYKANLDLVIRSFLMQRPSTERPQRRMGE